MPDSSPGARRPAPRPWPALAAAGLALAGVAACATTGALREQRGQGLTRFYGVSSFEQVWQAAVHAVRANNLRLDRADRGDRFIAATHLPSGDQVGPPDESVAIQANQGERIAIFVDSVRPNTWSVEVVTRRRFALDPTAQDWTKAIFLALERELGPEDRLQGPAPADSAR